MRTTFKHLNLLFPTASCSTSWWASGGSYRGERDWGGWGCWPPGQRWSWSIGHWPRGEAALCLRGWQRSPGSGNVSSWAQTKPFTLWSIKNELLWKYWPRWWSTAGCEPPQYLGGAGPAGLSQGTSPGGAAGAGEGAGGGRVGGPRWWVQRGDGWVARVIARAGAQVTRVIASVGVYCGQIEAGAAHNRGPLIGWGTRIRDLLDTLIGRLIGGATRKRDLWDIIASVWSTIVLYRFMIIDHVENTNTYFFLSNFLHLQEKGFKINSYREVWRQPALYRRQPLTPWPRLDLGYLRPRGGQTQGQWEDREICQRHFGSCAGNLVSITDIFCRPTPD